MADAWRDGPLPGTFRSSMVAHGDARGLFREIWRASWLAELDVGRIEQVNESRSNSGVVRGLHFHLRQTDIWVITDGEAHVQLVDLRAALDGHADGPSGAAAEVLTGGESLVIPPGIAHGLWALSDMRMLYFVTNEYDGTDEHGFAWNDPDAATAWPTGEPTLSERDRQAKSVGDAIVSARQDWQSLTR